MKYLAMIQARCGSTRLPNKVMKDLCGKPLLQWVIERVSHSKYIDEVMVVTSIKKDNFPIIRLCTELGIRVGIGSEDDVLDRYYQTAKLLKPEYVIRITADCPCIDAELIDYGIEQMKKDIDYCSNTIVPTFPDGLDFEIIKFSALELAWKDAKHTYEREHVTQYLIHHPELFNQMNIASPIGDFNNERWTVDEDADYRVVSEIYRFFVEQKSDEMFSYKDVLDFIKSHSDIKAINSSYERNEGLKKSIEEDRIIGE